MRIVSGEFRGRIIQSPNKQSVHPMSEKVRGAIFNVLGDILDLDFFDAYAGSGAVGLEAISRGAKHVTACEIDKNAVKTILQNIKKLGIQGQYQIIQANCASYIQNNPKEFNVIIADPPYNNVKTEQLTTLSGYLKPSGMFIVSVPPSFEMPEFNSLNLLKKKSYGDANIYYFKKNATLKEHVL